MPGIVRLFGDISIVGLGGRSRLEEFEWSRAPNVRLVECRARRYSLAEQIQVPIAIPKDTDVLLALVSNSTASSRSACGYGSRHESSTSPRDH
jgi:hypothetical protein